MYHNFLNHPAVRFKKASMKNIEAFYDALNTKFYLEEEKGLAWIDECIDAHEKSDDKKLKQLTSKGRFLTPGKFVIKTMIHNFTLDNGMSHDFFEELKAAVLNDNPNMTDIVIQENPTLALIFKFGEKEVKFFKLSDAFEWFKTFPDIENHNRGGRCHDSAVMVSTALDDKNYVATGYVHSFGRGHKYLHSWVELEYNGKQCVIDTTLNLFTRKSYYYDLMDVKGVVYKIPSKTIKNEIEIIRELTHENQWLSKLYLSNRHQALAFYKILKEKEKENNSQNAKS